MESTDGMNLVLLGPAGAGKGSVARALQDHANFEVFETGAALRRIPALKARLDEGNMAPTPVVMDLLENALKAAGPGRDWVLDGVPRNKEQVEAFMRRRADGRIRVTAAVVLEAPFEQLVPRLTGRTTCVECGRIYHDVHFPPPEPGRCACGAVARARDDDTPEGIARRHHLYRVRTEPAIQALEEAGLPIHGIDASQTFEAVFATVLRSLDLSHPGPVVSGR